MKVVVIRKYAMGYGWNYGKNSTVADPTHNCILAKYLGAGVTNPELVLDTHLTKELKDVEQEKTQHYKEAIGEFDNAEGSNEALIQIKELAKILKLQVRLTK